MKEHNILRVPTWAAKFIGKKMRLGALDDLVKSRQIRVDELSPGHKYDITFTTKLNCPCHMRDSKARISIKLQDGVLTAISTEFLAYVFNPPMVGWKQTGQPCMGKDDESAQSLIEQMSEQSAKPEIKNHKSPGKRRSAKKIAPTESKPSSSPMSGN